MRRTERMPLRASRGLLTVASSCPRVVLVPHPIPTQHKRRVRRPQCPTRKQVIADRQPPLLWIGCAVVLIVCQVRDRVVQAHPVRRAVARPGAEDGRCAHGWMLSDSLLRRGPRFAQGASTVPAGPVCHEVAISFSEAASESGSGMRLLPRGQPLLRTGSFMSWFRFWSFIATLPYGRLAIACL
jgi:hypothetical protein